MTGEKTEKTHDLSNLDLSAEQVAEIVGTSEEEVRVADAIISFVERNAALVRSMREQRGLSHKKLAQMLGLTPGRISQLESGQIRHAPNLKTLAEIAYRLDFDIEVSAHSNTPDTEPFASPDDLVSVDVTEQPQQQQKVAY